MNKSAEETSTKTNQNAQSLSRARAMLEEGKNELEVASNQIGKLKRELDL